MDKVREAKEFLKAFGMPEKQQTDIAAYTLLTLANIRPADDWSTATNHWIRIHDVLKFTSEYYGKIYAENTRETIRKNCMHQFREGALIEDNGKATNSPNYHYRITDEALNLMRAFGTSDWEKLLGPFRLYHQSLIEKYTSKREMQMMPVHINGRELKFSSGEHNLLQKAILEQFAPRFAPDSECLYVGDSIKKDLIRNKDKLAALGLEITLHDKMPDVILYRQDRNWLYFIEAVTSVGPMSPQRILEIQEMSRNAAAGKIFVTAFPDMDTYKKFSADLAWETEVWIAAYPDHMIHLNGDKFFGPRN